MTRKQEAAKYAASNDRRDAIIAALGMAPESNRYPHPDSYCATTGEFFRWLVQDKGAEFAAKFAA
jgi:hypothetical protein